MMNTTNAVAARENSQPASATTHETPTSPACPREAVSISPQSTKAIETTAATPKTTRSSFIGRSARPAPPGGSRAGCGPVSAREVTAASDPVRERLPPGSWPAPLSSGPVGDRSGVRML